MATVQLHTKLLLQQGRTAEDGHSPVTHQTLTAARKNCRRWPQSSYTPNSYCSKEELQKMATVQLHTKLLLQQGGTVEDGYTHLSRRLDRSGDREDQPTNQPTNQASKQQTRSTPRRLHPQTTEIYSHTDIATIPHSQHHFPAPSSKLCRNWLRH